MRATPPPPFPWFFSFLCVSTVVITLCSLLQFSPRYLHSIFLFKVFIHFHFILHSSLFLIFPPRPLYSRLQHPTTQTQPVLRESELLKALLLPFPPRRDGKEGTEAGMRLDERSGEDRFVRPKAQRVRGVKMHRITGFLLHVSAGCGTALNSVFVWKSARRGKDFIMFH